MGQEASKSNSKRSYPTPVGPLVQDMIPTYREKYDYVIFNRVPKVGTSGFPKQLPAKQCFSGFTRQLPVFNLFLVRKYVNDRVVLQTFWRQSFLC